MRFVPLQNLASKDGLVLAKSIYGIRGEVVLGAGRPLPQNLIDKIKTFGYNGIYIEDDESKGLEVTELINDELKYKTVFLLKNLFENVQREYQKPKPVFPRDSFRKLEKIADEIIKDMLCNYDLMVNNIDIKTLNDYTYFHAVNVAVLSLALGIELKLTRQDLYELCLAALLHDSGKMLLPKDLITKSKLTEDEEKLIKTHNIKAYKFLKDNVAVPVKAYCAVNEFNERFDGTGALGKMGEDIFILGRIINIANAYDKLISDKPLNKAKLPSEAMEYIMGANHIFDPSIVSVFTRKVAPYPIGTCVKLSNGKIGIVVENYKEVSLRPNVRILNNTDNENEYYNIDLFNNRDLTITEIVSY